MSVIHKKVLEKEVKQVALVSGGGAGHEYVQKGAAFGHAYSY